LKNKNILYQEDLWIGSLNDFVRLPVHFGQRILAIAVLFPTGRVQNFDFLFAGEKSLTRD
jgi:hypothetical protein